MESCVLLTTYETMKIQDNKPRLPDDLRLLLGGGVRNALIQRAVSRTCFVW